MKELSIKSYLKSQKFAHFERANEYVLLLNVSGQGRECGARLNNAAVDFHVSFDFERATVTEIQNIQQRGLSGSTSSLFHFNNIVSINKSSRYILINYKCLCVYHNSHQCAWFRYATDLKRKHSLRFSKGL